MSESKPEADTQKDALGQDPQDPAKTSLQREDPAHTAIPGPPPSERLTLDAADGASGSQDSSFKITAAFRPTSKITDSGAIIDLDSAAGEFLPIDDIRAAAGLTIPGYEILGEMGRGGMGVVYKARQKGLGRLVALKMVQSGVHAGKEQLARFRTEAVAVAGLQHPNIVQIYEVGEHQGLPYFSLEYVEGGSLANKLRGKPQPARIAAEVLVPIAQAVQYAHEHYIIHRDLKPANVLLTLAGIPKIADFGLAKRLEDDSGQTRTGTLMGTPSYMAPEQARGLTRDIGPRSDIYALGAILYEMLTGRAPFQGPTVLDTLEQVRSREPVPPSQLQPTVPADLETICLKCLQKEPRQRYDRAQDLSEDLRRFLAGEPILARPVSTVERAWRWCRRNPRVAILSGAVLMLLVTVAVGSTIAALVIAAEKRATEQARQLADDNAARERDAHALAEQKAEDERKAQVLAAEQRQLALDALGTLVGKVQTQLQDSANHQLRQDLLNTAIQGLQRVAASAGKNTGRPERNLAAAHAQMGGIFLSLGRTDAANQQYLRAHAILEALAQAEPHSDRNKGNLALSYSMLGDMSLHLKGGAAAAKPYYEKALALREAIVSHPESHELPVKETQLSLADSYDKLGTVLNDSTLARDTYRKGLTIREALLAKEPNNQNFKWALARSYQLVGLASSRLGETDQARAYFVKCMGLREQLVSASPKSMSLKRELGLTWMTLGDSYLLAGDAKEARKFYDRALTQTRQLVQADPQNATLKSDLASDYYRTATAALDERDAPSAERLYRESLKLRESLAAADPNSMPAKVALMVTLARCGEDTRAAQLAEELRRKLSKDAGTLFQITCCYSLCAATVGHGKTKEKWSPEERSLRQRYLALAESTLRDAIAQGYHEVLVLETDPDLRPIRSEAFFQSIVAELKSPNSATLNKP